MSSSKKNKGSKKQASFSVPPRANDEIIGRIGPNTGYRPAKRVVDELEHALNYEINSDAHREVVEKVKGGEVPRTYEVPGMTTDLVYGRDSRFELQNFPIPACTVQVLTDNEMGETDTKKKWTGGRAIMLSFLDGKAGSSMKKMGLFLLGECMLTRKDLWDYAVQLRRGNGQFVWPGYFAVLLCPFCANLAFPDESKTWIMAVQILRQEVDYMDGISGGGMSQRLIPRLCCKDCFLENLQPYEDDHPWGSYPNMLRYSVPGHEKLKRGNRLEDPCISAYLLSVLFENSGMSGAFSRLQFEALTKNLTARGDKARLSKSKTKENRGQGVIFFKAGKKCANCGKNNDDLKDSPGGGELSTCGGCSTVSYCGRDCQRQNWPIHKSLCKQIREKKKKEATASA
eukprot:CAMPEP_0196818426 /NCGR_PEP_ID=MMETSP1362-20130617/65517_1 /TAXON_ID=163516 /ORGANISM="Leptocylindrus danicus, Strain CCMP1856" /LENGTH=398 /DNA_ID=CAMNT_0042196527 /DNA_START=15 /DNA_END=1211 /DNA_ORIENTATION=+